MCVCVLCVTVRNTVCIYCRVLAVQNVAGSTIPGQTLPQATQLYGWQGQRKEAVRADDCATVFNTQNRSLPRPWVMRTRTAWELLYCVRGWKPEWKLAQPWLKACLYVMCVGCCWCCVCYCSCSACHVCPFPHSATPRPVCTGCPTRPNKRAWKMRPRLAVGPRQEDAVAEH